MQIQKNMAIHEYLIIVCGKKVIFYRLEDATHIQDNQCLMDPMLYNLIIGMGIKYM